MKSNSENYSGPALVKELIALAKKAGEAILKVYTSEFAVEEKEDKSPLTLADRTSHEIISAYLKKRHPFPVLSEEGKDIPYAERKQWEYFWLVDPLDGTKEFIKRNGEFTVNISLIHKNGPVLGVIYVPVSDVVYYAVNGEGAYKLEQHVSTRLPLPSNQNGVTVVGSRSHGSKELDDLVMGLRERHGTLNFLSAGSSLKFCLVAEGKADIYPRLGPTMEWDTAAGQVIVEEAGGQVVEFGSKQPLRYNKESLLNGHFISFRGDYGD